MFRRVFIVCLSLASLFAVGCGSSDTPRADVSGKISYKGQPLTAGSVSFVNGNNVATAQIENGQYKIADAAVGDNQIAIVTPASNMAPQQMQQTKQKVDGKSFTGTNAVVVPVPPNFNDPATSGLKYTVTKESPQTHDITIQ